jgi:hypothetical protein
MSRLQRIFPVQSQVISAEKSGSRDKDQLTEIDKTGGSPFCRQVFMMNIRALSERGSATGDWMKKQGPLSAISRTADDECYQNGDRQDKKV